MEITEGGPKLTRVPTGKDKEVPAKPARVAICRVDEIFSKKDRKVHLVKSARNSDTEKFSKYALVVRRVFNYKDEYEYTEIDIRGYHLRDILRDMYPDTEGMKLAENPPVATKDLLYHSYEGLQTKLSKAQTATPPNENLTFDLNSALDFIRQEFGDIFETLEAFFAKGEITFEYLWALFRPCEPIYQIDELGEPRVYIAKTHRRLFEDNKLFYEVNYEYIDSDGTCVGQTAMVRTLIPFYKGAKSITSLKVFPLRYHPNNDELRERLIRRGRLGLSMQGRQFKAYHGHALKEVIFAEPLDKWGDPKPVKFEKFNSHGRVITDPDVYNSVEAANRVLPTITRPIDVEDLTEDQIMTYSSMLYGFSLGDKTWGGFAIERLSEIIWDDGIFESLVMTEPQKSLIHTLFRVHGSKKHNFDDFVADKGKGLIGLLTGPPGVGKTLTAEAVAEVSRRPLYMVTSAELGDSPSKISFRIAKILEVCQIWNAVLLLDEADVFLAKRDDVSLERNAIVSIFLRQVEYYRGILILTTNRVETIDPAFQSRIHFNHAYPDLDKTARTTIWKNFIKLGHQGSENGMHFSAEDVDDLSEHNLNGRQIKNTMSIAQAIAIEGGKPLSADQVKLVIKHFQSSSIG